MLVVEDNQINQLILRDQLNALGCRVELAGNGQEALQRGRAEDIDVVLTDLNMPRMDGYQLASELRQRGWQQPIIGATANAMREERERCTRGGTMTHHDNLHRAEVGPIATLEGCRTSERLRTTRKAPTAAAPLALASTEARIARNLIDFTPEQEQMIRDTFANGASPSEFKMLMGVSRALGLDPITRQIYFVQRWDAQKSRNVWAYQTSIDGLRSKAEATGVYDGQDEPGFVAFAEADGRGRRLRVDLEEREITCRNVDPDAVARQEEVRGRPDLDVEFVLAARFQRLR